MTGPRSMSCRCLIYKHFVRQRGEKKKKKDTLERAQRKEHKATEDIRWEDRKRERSRLEHSHKWMQNCVK